MDEICSDFQSDIENSVPRAIAQEILNNLFTQKASGKFCDVQFLHGSAIVWAHSCVLASYSPYMMRLFNKYEEENISWSFDKPMKVNISSVSKCNGTSRNNCVSCTCKIIDFIYTGKIKLDPYHLDHVVNLSNNLEIDVLLLICQRYKRDNVSLIDSLPKSNRISTVNSFEEVIDIKAYVDHLNNSISNTSNGKNDSSEQAQKEISQNTDLIRKLPTLINGNDKTSVDTKTSPIRIKPFRSSISNTNNVEQVVKAEKKEYVCTACNFKSANHFKLKQHKKVFHKRNYVCLECDYTSFKMADVIDHLQKSSHGGTTCSVCLFEAENVISLQSHLTEHSRSYPFKCSMCKQQFKYRNDWVRHKYSPFHEKELLNSIEKLNITQDGKQNYACRICKYEFSNNELLQKHGYIFHKRKYICLSCDFNTFKIDTIIEHLIEKEHDENVCSICLYVASNKNTLKNHILDHKNSQPFSCTICQSRFQTRNEWWRHELAHGTDKPFKCQFCELSFQTSPYLKTHILYRHKQKMHTCNICGYGAPFASKLEKHYLTHKNKYQCKHNSCTFNCSSEVMLKKHKKIHVTKPLACPICNLKFKFVRNMKRHVKLAHNAQSLVLTCPSCNYTNNRLDKLKEHCKNIHPNDNNILELINKQYENTKTYLSPKVIKKQRRSQPVKEKPDENKNGLDEICASEKQADNMLEPPKNCDNNFISNTISDPLKQTVLLSEATSQLNILCENEGKPIPVASVTSTNMLTIGNFREGTGSVTLNETTGVLTLNNINVDSKGAVFLNESTGVLSYINLNMDNDPEVNNLKECCNVRPEQQVQLNEVTGEIVPVTEDPTVSNKNVISPMEEDFLFDSFGVDFNEDSCDGFDDFDSLFFDTFSPFDSESATNVEEILKNNSNELFDIPRLDEMTGELTFDNDSLERKCNNITQHEDMWSSVNTFPENSIMDSVTSEGYESLLNEVTGELS